VTCGRAAPGSNKLAKKKAAPKGCQGNEAGLSASFILIPQGQTLLIAAMIIFGCRLAFIVPTKPKKTPTFSDIPPSPVSISDEVAKVERVKGIKVVRFDVAEPIFPPPEEAVRGTMEALAKGLYKYSSSWGVLELRRAIYNYLKIRGVSLDDEEDAKEVLVTVGGKFADFAFFSGLFRCGDSVVLVKPYWVSFKAAPLILNLKAIECWSNEPYHLDHESLKSAMDKRPKAIVVNSPSNPTGGVLNQDDLHLLRDLVVDNDLYVLSDEIDWAYIYDGNKFVSPFSIEELRGRTVISDGFSKVFGMTGWRVGFAAGPVSLLEKMHKVQEHAVSSPTTFAQYGCISALSDCEVYIKNLVGRCDANRKKIVDCLNSIPGLICPMPEGGFYVYPEFKDNFSKDAATLSKRLLCDAGVSVVPGEYFGDSRRRFRICYALEESTIDEGLRRLKTFFESLPA